LGGGEENDDDDKCWWWSSEGGGGQFRSGRCLSPCFTLLFLFSAQEQEQPLFLQLPHISTQMTL